MFYKRMAAIHQRAREWREQLWEANRVESGRLWEEFGEVLAGVREALDVSPDEAAIPLTRCAPGPDGWSSACSVRPVGCKRLCC
jgi:hypothetical protein